MNNLKTQFLGFINTSPLFENLSALNQFELAIDEIKEFDVSDVEENTLSILSRYVDEAEFEESSLEKDAIKNLISDIYREACEV